MTTEEQYREEAEEYAGSHYTRNHFPKNWNDRYQAYIAGRRASAAQLEAAEKFIDALGDVVTLVHKYGTVSVSHEEEVHFAALKASDAGELYKSFKRAPPTEDKTKEI